MEVVVATSQTRGRHLIATRSFEAGEVVVSQLPYAAVLFNEHVVNFCNYCFRPGSDLRRCSRSKFARYCCREHQLLDWKEGYKQECEFLTACAPRIPPSTIRLAAHVAWKRRKELEEGKTHEFWNSFPAVESLMDHWDDLDEERMKTFAEMGCFITTAIRSIKEGEEITITYVDLMSTSSEANEILKKDYLFDYLPPINDRNRGTILRVSDRLEGRIWKRHRPTWLTTEKDIRLTSVEDSNGVGHHGLMILLHEIIEERRTTHWIEWDAESEHRDTAKLETKQHITVHLWGDWIRRKDVDRVSVIKKACIIQTLFSESQGYYDRGQFSESVKQLQMCLDKTTECLCADYRLADAHIVHIRTLDLLRKAVVDAGCDWQLALESYRRLIPQLDDLFPHFWSERGSQLAALARLESNYGDIKHAFKAAEDAVHILRVTDGSGEVMQEMKALMAQLRHEIHFQKEDEEEARLLQY